MSHFSENTTRYTTSQEIFEYTASKTGKHVDASTMELDDESLINEQLNGLKSQQQYLNEKNKKTNLN